MKRQLYTKGHGGFTLIELLIVIAIIAILASILFPVFARARENARRSSCQSNLKQLSLAMMQYLQDCDERFPGYYGYQPTNTGAPFWPTELKPYFNSDQLLLCPSDKYTKRGGWLCNYLLNGMLGCATDASGNAVKGQAVPGATNCSGQGLISAVVALPSQTILYTEGVSSYNPIGAWKTYIGTLSPSVGYAMLGSYFSEDAQYHASIHLEGMNMAFVDGHVKWYPRAKLETLGTTVPFAGHKLDLGPTGNLNKFYKHNGDIDQQPLTSTQWDP
jgi:prepilin-type N-terminal cleavage/methylation domain-containing protein/prepilin-type processing-associated H-X9-DG protein